MSLALPVKLAGPPLTEREAISDALYRAVLAFDHADEALLRSAATEDIVVDMAGHSLTGIPAFKEALFDRVSKLDTTHFLSNIRISIESATTAKATCSALAQHVRLGQRSDPSAPKLTSGGMYFCDLIKVGDLWMIESWKADFTWLDGDASVMSGE